MHTDTESVNTGLAEADVKRVTGYIMTSSVEFYQAKQGDHVVR